MENNRKHNRRLGQKTTPSAKLFVALETAGAIAAALFLLTSVIVYTASESAGLKTFSALFYPIVICLALAFTSGINQLLRGKQPLAAVSLAVAVICLALTIAAIVYECTTYGKLYLVPFTFVDF